MTYRTKHLAAMLGELGGDTHQLAMLAEIEKRLHQFRRLNNAVNYLLNTCVEDDVLLKGCGITAYAQLINAVEDIDIDE